MTTESYEFELIFALPDGPLDPLDLSNAVFDAGFEDALIGTGTPGLIAIGLELEGHAADDVILHAAKRLIAALPPGSALREIRPDLVSLADVAERLDIKRQALQQRKMPPPVMGGLYRIDEIQLALTEAVNVPQGKRRPRFDLQRAQGWFRAGAAARQLNARLTIREIDPHTAEYVGGDRAARPRP